MYDLTWEIWLFALNAFTAAFSRFDPAQGYVPTGNHYEDQNSKDAHDPSLGVDYHLEMISGFLIVISSTYFEIDCCRAVDYHPMMAIHMMR